MTEVRILVLQDGRKATVIPADAAGEFFLRVPHGVFEQLHEAGYLSWRQFTALETLSRCYRAAGGLLAWYRGGGDGERDDAAVRAKVRELEDLLGRAPEPTRWRIVSMIQSGEWDCRARLTQVQDAADAIADRLRLAKEAP
jgi:hypothetical protein